MTSTEDVGLAPDSVELRVPADPAYLAVIRTAAAGLAARLDLTLDEIEDLRIAVDEACALLLDQRGHRGSHLTTVFSSGAGTLDVTVTGPARPLPDRTSFAWAVLEALVGSVETGQADPGAGIPEGGSWIRLSRAASRAAS